MLLSYLSLNPQRPLLLFLVLLNLNLNSQLTVVAIDENYAEVQGESEVESVSVDANDDESDNHDDDDAGSESNSANENKNVKNSKSNSGKANNGNNSKNKSNKNELYQNNKPEFNFFDTKPDDLDDQNPNNLPKKWKGFHEFTKNKIIMQIGRAMHRKKKDQNSSGEWTKGKKGIIKSDLDILDSAAEEMKEVDSRDDDRYQWGEHWDTSGGGKVPAGSPISIKYLKNEDRKKGINTFLDLIRKGLKKRKMKLEKAVNQGGLSKDSNSDNTVESVTGSVEGDKLLLSSIRNGKSTNGITVILSQTESTNEPGVGPEIIFSYWIEPSILNVLADSDPDGSNVGKYGYADLFIKQLNDYDDTELGYHNPKGGPRFTDWTYVNKFIKLTLERAKEEYSRALEKSGDAVKLWLKSYPDIKEECLRVEGKYLDQTRGDDGGLLKSGSGKGDDSDSGLISRINASLNQFSWEQQVAFVVTWAMIISIGCYIGGCLGKCKQGCRRFGGLENTGDDRDLSRKDDYDRRNSRNRFDSRDRSDRRPPSSRRGSRFSQRRDDSRERSRKSQGPSRRDLDSYDNRRSRSPARQSRSGPSGGGGGGRKSRKITVTVDESMLSSGMMDSRVDSRINSRLDSSYYDDRDRGKRDDRDRGGRDGGRGGGRGGGSGNSNRNSNYGKGGGRSSNYGGGGGGRKSSHYLDSQMDSGITTANTLSNSRQQTPNFGPSAPVNKGNNGNTGDIFSQEIYVGNQVPGFNLQDPKYGYPNDRGVVIGNSSNTAMSTLGNNKNYSTGQNSTAVAAANSTQSWGTAWNKSFITPGGGLKNPNASANAGSPAVNAGWNSSSAQQAWTSNLNTGTPGQSFAPSAMSLSPQQIYVSPGQNPTGGFKPQQNFNPNQNFQTGTVNASGQSPKGILRGGSPGQTPKYGGYQYYPEKNSRNHSSNHTEGESEYQDDASNLLYQESNDRYDDNVESGSESDSSGTKRMKEYYNKSKKSEKKSKDKSSKGSGGGRSGFNIFNADTWGKSIKSPGSDGSEFNVYNPDTWGKGSNSYGEEETGKFNLFNADTWGSIFRSSSDNAGLNRGLSPRRNKKYSADYASYADEKMFNDSGSNFYRTEDIVLEGQHEKSNTDDVNECIQNGVKTVTFNDDIDAYSAASLSAVSAEGKGSGSGFARERITSQEALLMAQERT